MSRLHVGAYEHILNLLQKGIIDPDPVAIAPYAGWGCSCGDRSSGLRIELRNFMYNFRFDNLRGPLQSRHCARTVRTSSIRLRSRGRSSRTICLWGWHSWCGCSDPRPCGWQRSCYWGILGIGRSSPVPSFGSPGGRAENPRPMARPDSDRDRVPAGGQTELDTPDRAT